LKKLKRSEQRISSEFSLEEISSILPGRAVLELMNLEQIPENSVISEH